MNGTRAKNKHPLPQHLEIQHTSKYHIGQSKSQEMKVYFEIKENENIKPRICSMHFF